MSLLMGLVMLGILALAIDCGYLFQRKRMAQAAADAAAVAAAEEVTAGNTVSSASVVNAANVASTFNGFDTTLTNKPATVTLSTLSAGNYSNAGSGAAPSSWVQATVSQPIQTFFLGAFNPVMKLISVSATAVAAAGAASPSCICLTGTTGTDLNMSNNASLNANQCGVTANSSSNNAITVVGSASICGTTVAAVSTNWNNTNNINNNGTICPAAARVQGSAPCGANLVAPAMPAGLAGNCTSNPIQGYDLAANSLNSNNYNGNYSLPFNGAQKMVNGSPVAIPNDTVVSNSACYTNFNLSNAAQVVFAPGTYYINGDFTTGGGEKISGTGITFVVSGTINIANGVTINLSAPTINGVPGTLFYGTGSNPVTIQGGSNSSFSGVIDVPNSNLTLNNGTGTTTNMDIVANTLTMAGGAALNSYATPAMSGTGTGIAKLSQ
jgi:hypothetical protein